MTETTPLPSYPIASNGKRNWAHSAVRPGEPLPGKDTIPEGGSSGGSFLSSLIDIINPLQHIPIISTIYRAMTGDTISAPGRIIGGLLFGGPVGFMAGVGETLVAEAAGIDVGERALALLSGDDKAAAKTVSQVYSKAYELRADTHTEPTNRLKV